MTGIKLVDEAIEKAKTSTKSAEELLAEKVILGTNLPAHKVTHIKVTSPDEDDKFEMHREAESESRERAMSQRAELEAERMAGYGD